MNHHDPYNPFSEKSQGIATLGTLFFCVTSGAGVGVFMEKPEIGAIVGAVIGILAAVFLLPALLRDWRD